MPENISDVAIQFKNPENKNRVDLYASDDLQSKSEKATECMDTAIEHFVINILNLSLNQKSMDVIFKAAEQLVKNLQVFNQHMITDDNGMSSLQALDKAQSFVCGNIREWSTKYYRKKNIHLMSFLWSLLNILWV